MDRGWKRNYLRYRSYFLNIAGRYKERADIRAYLEILLSLATISIFSIFALRPTLLTIAELIREIETKRVTLAKMDEKITNLSRAQSVYDQERPRILLLQTAIPDKPNPDTFARQIEGLSQKHQSGILGISLGEATILGTSADKKLQKDLKPLPEGASQMTFSVKTKVPLEQYKIIANFFTDLENLRRPLKIDLVKLSSVSEKSEKSILLVVDGRLPYYFPKREDK